MHFKQPLFLFLSLFYLTNSSADSEMRILNYPITITAKDYSGKDIINSKFYATNGMLAPIAITASKSLICQKNCNQTSFFLIHPEYDKINDKFTISVCESVDKRSCVGELIELKYNKNNDNFLSLKFKSIPVSVSAKINNEAK